MITKDNEEIYDSQIAPLMAQIIEICHKNKIPMIATFNYSSKELCTTRIPQVVLYGEEDEDGKLLNRVNKAIFHRDDFAAFMITTTTKKE